MLLEAGFSEHLQSSVSACFCFFFPLLRISPSAPCNCTLAILSSGLPLDSALGLVSVGCESSPRGDLEAADPGSHSDSALTCIRVCS